MATKKAAPAKTAAKAKPVDEAAATGGDASEAAEGTLAPAARGPSLKIKDLVERVSAATGGKKKDVKSTVEATLKVLGDAMAAGEDLNLPGLGRAKVARTMQKDGGSMLVLKVKRGAHRPKTAEEPLAEDGEDS